MTIATYLAQREEHAVAAVRILADAIEVSVPQTHAAVRSLTRILRAYVHGDADADLNEASRAFGEFDRSTRLSVAAASVRGAADFRRRRMRGESLEPMRRLQPQGPGLVGVINRG